MLRHISIPTKMLAEMNIVLKSDIVLDMRKHEGTEFMLRNDSN